MKILAISRIYEKGLYKKCGVYECSMIYTNTINIHSEDGKIAHALNDKDFIFIFNVNEESEKFIRDNAILFI